MSYESNLLQNNNLRAYTMNVPKDIMNAINTASQSSGVDFSYLMNQAKAESSFDPKAQSKTSSATGLYQFIDSTWLQMVDRYGDQYGIETEGKSRSEILNMRKDPEKASFMAAAFASENERFLNTNWGGEVGATELYLAHFLGASGAASFLNARDENPIQYAADLNPRAAKANVNVFYDRETGKPRTMEQVYQFFDEKFQSEHNKAEERQVASIPTPPEVPMQKRAHKNSLYPHRISDNVIMQRAQAMRNGTYEQQNNAIQEGNSLFKTVQTRQASHVRKNIPQSAFFSLIAEPLDLMVMTQTTSPTKVVRDKS